MSSRQVRSLRYFSDDRGDSLFDVFGDTAGISGQFNVSKIDKGVVKAFHFHKNQKDYVICLSGKLRLVTMDQNMRDFEEYILSPHNPCVIEIDAYTYHGYQSLEDNSVILYYCDNRFDPDNPDEDRLPWDVIGREIWDIGFK
jgi:dTDP-4-dehydrorhamnose 3,5-epimerase